MPLFKVGHCNSLKFTPQELLASAHMYNIPGDSLKEVWDAAIAKQEAKKVQAARICTACDEVSLAELLNELDKEAPKSV